MKRQYRRLMKYFQKTRDRLNQIYKWPTANPPWQKLYFCYWVVFDIWQQWNNFCREIVLLSCCGTLTKSGRRVSKRVADNSWNRIAYEVKEYAGSRIPGQFSKINYRRHEPTWGDINVLLKSLPRLNPSNLGDLINGFGVSLSGPKHLQIVRNACAHLNAESMDDVKRISISYVGKSIKHPVDIMWWVEPANRSDAIFCWISDLEVIADLVTN